MNLITGGRVVVVGPLSVTEGNSGETVLELDIQLDPDIIILNRDVAYTIVLTDGTAEGQLIFKWMRVSLGLIIVLVS